MDGVVFPDGQEISVKEMRKIPDTGTCVLVENNTLLKIQFYSPETKKDL